MSVGTFIQPDHLTQDGSAYKLAIKNSTMVMSRLAAAFAPHEQDTPNMTVRVDAGYLWVDGVLTEIAAQNSATITAPSTNPRIDRVVKDIATAAISVVTGTEAASPDAPDIPDNKEPICQIALETTTTAIDNTMITDERVTPVPSAESSWPVGAVFQATVATDPATLLGFGSWQAMEAAKDISTGLLMNFEGSGATMMDESPHVNVVTAVGNATQSTTQKKFGSKSLALDGTGDYLSVAANPLFDTIFAANFTIDFWAYISTVTDRRYFASYGSGNNGFGFLIENTGVYLGFYINGSAANWVPWSPSLNTWIHFAVVRYGGNTLKLFVNGVLLGSAWTNASSGAAAGTPLKIGTSYAGTQNLSGYLDAFRITNYPRWTSNFTPPAAPVEEIYQWKRTA